MRSWNFRGFAKDNSGGVLIYTAFGMVAFLGMMALAVDVGYWYTNKRDMQSAADAAAMAAAFELLDGGDQTDMESVARFDAELNGYDGTTVTLNQPPTSGDFDGNPNAVEIIVLDDTEGFLSAAVGHEAGSIKSRATAFIPFQDACIYALNPTVSNAVSAGGGADVSMDCGILANTTDNPNGVNTSGASSSITASTISVVGGGSGNLTATETLSVTNGIDPFGDPLGYLDPPASAPYTCTQSGNLNIVNRTEIFTAGTVYCGNISLQNDAVAIFEPGLHIFDAGFSISAVASAQITGTGVTLYFTENATAGFTVASGAQMVMSAPLDSTDGGIPGILVYEHRDNGGLSHNFTGNATMDIQGVFYAPNGSLMMAGGASGTPQDMIIIADTVNFFGNNSYLTGDAGTGSVLHTFYKANIRLVE